MRAILVALLFGLAVEARSPVTKKGKEGLYNYSSITAVYYPDEAGSSALCRALDCQDNQLCVIYHSDRAVCMTEKAWKKLVASKRAEKQKKPVGSSPAKTLSSLTNNCQPCPVVHPVFVCGTDNVTYSSECRLQFKNCEDNTSVKVACQGRCPCPVLDQSEPVAVQTPSSRKNVKPKMKFGFKGEHPTKNATESENHVGIQHNGKDNRICSKKELRELKRRLIAWFWTIFRQKFPEGDPSDLTESPVCNRGANPGILSWMFSYFDNNKDQSLTLTELFSMEADKYEHCINPFLEQCDTDNDLDISGHEWCRCLQKHA